MSSQLDVVRRFHIPKSFLVEISHEVSEIKVPLAWAVLSPKLEDPAVDILVFPYGQLCLRLGDEGWARFTFQVVGQQ